MLNYVSVFIGMQAGSENQSIYLEDVSVTEYFTYIILLP